MRHACKYVQLFIVLVIAGCSSTPRTAEMAYFDGKKDYLDLIFMPPHGAAVFTILFRFKMNATWDRNSIEKKQTFVPLEITALNGDEKNDLYSVKFFLVLQPHRNAYFTFQAATWDPNCKSRMLPRLNVGEFNNCSFLKATHRVAAVLGGGSFKLFFDGINISARRLPQYLPYCLNAPRYRLRIGASTWRNGTCFFPGRIGHVAVFAKLLTEDQIYAYQSGKKILEPGIDGLLLSWCVHSEKELVALPEIQCRVFPSGRITED